MSKAFDYLTSEPQDFDEGYVISGNLYPTLEEAVAVFSKDFGYEVDPNDVHKTWCHWHAGLDDEGQPRNMWWQHDQYEGRRGAQSAWMAQMDRHKRRHGHSYERSEHGRLLGPDPCKVCGERA